MGALRNPRLGVRLLVALSVATFYGLRAVPASAAANCSYTAGTKTVAIAMDTANDDVTVRVNGGDIEVNINIAPFTQCGAATTANTDTIRFSCDGSNNHDS